MLFFQGGADDPRQVADILGHEEVVLHEAFHVFHARMLRVAKTNGDLPLHFE